MPTDFPLLCLDCGTRSDYDDGFCPRCGSDRLVPREEDDDDAD